jgi:hypothetical protein
LLSLLLFLFLQLLAVKFVPRPLPKAAVPLMLAEVELQAQLGEGHVNIITMRELMLTRTHLGLVMDYASGKELVGLDRESTWGHGDSAAAAAVTRGCAD